MKTLETARKQTGMLSIWYCSAYQWHWFINRISM